MTNVITTPTPRTITTGTRTRIAPTVTGSSRSIAPITIGPKPLNRNKENTGAGATSIKIGSTSATGTAKNVADSTAETQLRNLSSAFRVMRATAGSHNSAAIQVIEPVENTSPPLLCFQ